MLVHLFWHMVLSHPKETAQTAVVVMIVLGFIAAVLG